MVGTPQPFRPGPHGPGHTTPGDRQTDPGEAPMTDLHVYDTTLRDGAQQEGLNLSVGDKLTIAAHLDELGVGFIEGGWPGANPKDTEFFARAARGGGDATSAPRSRRARDAPTSKRPPGCGRSARRGVLVALADNERGGGHTKRHAISLPRPRPHGIPAVHMLAARPARARGPPA